MLSQLRTLGKAGGLAKAALSSNQFASAGIASTAVAQDKVVAVLYKAGEASKEKRLLGKHRAALKQRDPSLFRKLLRSSGVVGLPRHSSQGRLRGDHAVPAALASRLKLCWRVEIARSGIPKRSEQGLGLSVELLLA